MRTRGGAEDLGGTLVKGRHAAGLASVQRRLSLVLYASIFGRHNRLVGAFGRLQRPGFGRGGVRVNAGAVLSHEGYWRRLGVEVWSLTGLFTTSSSLKLSSCAVWSNSRWNEQYVTLHSKDWRPILAEVCTCISLKRGSTGHGSLHLAWIHRHA